MRMVHDVNHLQIAPEGETVSRGHQANLHDGKSVAGSASCRDVAGSDQVFIADEVTCSPQVQTASHDALDDDPRTVRKKGLYD
jgi:hypothetical protein